MKLTKITYTDGTVGYETEAIGVTTIGGVKQKEQELHIEEGDINTFFEKPDKFKIKGDKLVEKVK